MKILIVSPAYPPAAAGEAEHCHQIAARMAHAGHEVRVVTSCHEAPVNAKGFQLRAVMSGWRWRHLPLLWAEIVRFRPDGVVLIYATWLYEGHPMITFLPTMLRRWLSSARLMCLMEIYQQPPKAALGSRLGRKLLAMWSGQRGVDYDFGTLLRDSHVVAALGPTIVTRFAQHDASLPLRALVIPPPPLVAMPGNTSDHDRQRARTALGVAPDECLLAFFGYVYPGKGVDTLIAALRCLVDRGRKVRLVMAGGGRGATAEQANHGERHGDMETQMHALAERLGVSALIAWPEGYVGGSEAPSMHLVAADVAVLPFDDGAELRRSSIAVVAALGLPIVTTQPSLHEPAFVAGQSMLLCPPRDAEAIVDAVCRICDDPELRARLQRGALELASEWFSWDGAIRKMTSALEKRPLHADLAKA